MHGTQETIIASESGHPDRSPRVRSVRPDDDAAVAAMISRCSADTLYRRFFTPLPTSGQDESMLDRLTRASPDDAAILVEIGVRAVAVGSYHRHPAEPDTAELAFLVEDAYQRHGLGTLLVQHLARRALRAGITAFTADVLSENRGPQAALRKAGYKPKVETSTHGVSQIRVSLAQVGPEVHRLHPMS